MYHFAENNNFYDDSATSTYQKAPSDFAIGYADSSVKGTVGIDSVSVI